MMREEDEKRRLRTSQRRWCSFRSDHLEDDLNLMWSYGRIAKPITMPITAGLWNVIIEEGWRRI